MKPDILMSAREGLCFYKEQLRAYGTLTIIPINIQSRDSSVNTVNRLKAGRQGSSFQQ